MTRAPCYIVPSDKVGRRLVVICEATQGKGAGGLGRVVVSKRDPVIALEPHNKGSFIC
jgi:non-homologous end joining protein Ku